KMVDVIKQIRFETFEKHRAEILSRQGIGEAAVKEFIDDLRQEHLASIGQLSLVLEATSICGLGRVVHVPIQTVLKHFPEEIEQHLRGEWVGDESIKG